MITRIILAILVAIITSLVCIFVGGLLIALEGVQVAVALGALLKTYSTVIGILAGLWWYFSGANFPTTRA